MSKKKRNYINEPFIYIPRRVIKSPAYSALTGNAVKVLTLILNRWNGSNNGFIQFGYADTGLHHATAKRSLLDLQDKGLIERTKAGCYKGNVSEYRITFLNDDRTGQKPTNDWEQYPNNEKDDLIAAKRDKAARKNNLKNNPKTKEANDNAPAPVMPAPVNQNASADALLKSLENLKRKQGLS